MWSKKGPTMSTQLLNDPSSGRRRKTLLWTRLRHVIQWHTVPLHHSDKNQAIASCLFMSVQRSGTSFVFIHVNTQKKVLKKLNAELHTSEITFKKGSFNKYLDGTVFQKAVLEFICSLYCHGEYACKGTDRFGHWVMSAARHVY